MQTKELRKICDIFTSIIKLVPVRPITDLVEIFCKDGIARFGSTDNRTTIVASIPNENDIDNAVISLSTFTKLVKLTTKDEITLTNKGKYISFKGNGYYKIPIQCDEMGRDIYLPLEMPELTSQPKVYSSGAFKKIKERNKVALYEGDGHSELVLYFNSGTNIISSNSIIISSTRSIAVPIGNIQPFVVDQLSVLDGDLNLYDVDNGFRVKNENFDIYIINKLYDEFPIDIVKPFLVEPKDNSNFVGQFSITKKELQDALKRQELFKSVFDIPSIIFSLDDGEVTINNPQGTASETLCSGTGSNIKIKVASSVLMSVVKCLQNEITIYIGKGMLGLVDSEGFYIVSEVEE